MIDKRVYVRCPADYEDSDDPRIFICGQVAEIDEYKNTVIVRIYDPFDNACFYEKLPNKYCEVPIESVMHCRLFIGSFVVYKDKECKVLTCQKSTSGIYFYYLQNTENKEIQKVCEKNIIAAFNNGEVEPTEQLIAYELQNPCWYFGRYIVSRSMNILENSIYGFKELAGFKIYLLPHQINTIMRCMQNSPIRYMLADEVGMGKTIEATSVLMIYLMNKCGINILIIVPDTLKEQWKTELFLKFKLFEGRNHNDNTILFRTIEELTAYDCKKHWDFVIVDEVHKYLEDLGQYDKLHSISQNSQNILLLSATPVQQRKEEYLDLLRLLQPAKYDEYTLEKFSKLIDKQGIIIQNTAMILDTFSEYEEELLRCYEDGCSPLEDEDCNDLFDEITEGLNDICEELNDKKLSLMFNKINFKSEDNGTYDIKVVISYVCSNYQIESNIIRNRRRILESNNDEEEKLMPSRELEELTYDWDNSVNAYEEMTWQKLTEWINRKLGKKEIDINNQLKPILQKFFSSATSFYKYIESNSNIDEDIINDARRWYDDEQEIIANISIILDDPDAYEDEYATRLVTVMDYLYEMDPNDKAVIFTNDKETFEVYKKALEKTFPNKQLSFFGEEMTRNAVELDSYRFQNDSNCQFMLCDYTGGEGRNFQCADYVIHIDLPWDANMIEQRIGRLDRLERDRDRSIVYSVVVHTKETFENALFDFWNQGLNIFRESLSGMEIIMKDVNQEILEAINENFEYGLSNKISNIIKLTKNMKETIRKEQNYDAAGFIYRPMYAELRKLIEFYSENENELFARTMSEWSSLAGFRGSSSKNNIITYTSSSFSPKSAIKSMLIPPRWDNYLNEQQNRFMCKIRELYCKTSKIKELPGESIRGTFERKIAIENDYIHFFAPGDKVFDCIIDNAINSCKGRASAFAIKTNINWVGLIYTWSVIPNNAYLLDKGISLYALSPYRGYLASAQVAVPYSIFGDDEDQVIIKELNLFINSNISSRKYVHLGKRTKAPGFMADEIGTNRNIDWFKQTFTEDEWKDIVIEGKKVSKKKAVDILAHSSNIRGAREEMDRVLSAKIANSEYYELDQNNIDEIKYTQSFILEALRKPIVKLDSVSFVWMVKKNDQ